MIELIFVAVLAFVGGFGIGYGLQSRRSYNPITITDGPTWTYESTITQPYSQHGYCEPTKEQESK